MFKLNNIRREEKFVIDGETYNLQITGRCHPGLTKQYGFYEKSLENDGLTVMHKNS